MKPYIICYMMTSADGRIDCGMTAQLPGGSSRSDVYYQVLDELDILTTVTGRHTAELEMSLPGKFQAEDHTGCGKENFSRKTDAAGYVIVADTHGTLLWNKETDTEKPLLILTSTSAPQEYLDYLDRQNISWIACGNEHIDLKRASEILNTEFGVQRMGIVGGAAINTGFLTAGLLDEVALLIGPGIDGRTEMPSVFEGREDASPLPLRLKNVKSYDNGDVVIRYQVK